MSKGTKIALACLICLAAGALVVGVVQWLAG
jgi:hypothetical protein